MKLNAIFLLAAATVTSATPSPTATAIETNTPLIPTFDGCNYERVFNGFPWDNCDGVCKKFSCYMACARVGGHDKASDFVMTGDDNQNGNCRCRCWFK